MSDGDENKVNFTLLDLRRSTTSQLFFLSCKLVVRDKLDAIALSSLPFSMGMAKLDQTSSIYASMSVCLWIREWIKIYGLV